jgi:FkbM family methyltransferase
VWAIEPLASNACNLLRHIQLNELSNVTLLQAAAADKAGLEGFVTAESNAMGRLGDTRCAYRVPTVSLDGLLESGAIPLPDVIKIDVEGAESRVLEGASQLMSQRRTTLFIAIHGRDQFERCLAILARCGFTCTRLNGSSISPGEYCDEILARPAA